MSMRLPSCILLGFTVCIFVSSARSIAQTVPPRDQWGEKFNSPGVVLKYREVARTGVQSTTMVTYNLFASGLPKEQHYVLCLLNVGSAPRGITDAYLNSEGKVVNVQADPERHIAEDPINLKLFASKGEPFQFALISDDDSLRAFIQIIPFPVEENAGPCHLSLIETGPNYVGVFIRVTGLGPGEQLSIEQQSESEGGTSTGKADAEGTYNAALLPFVKGKRSGKARFAVAAKSCKIGISFPWGEGSQQYQ